MDFPKKQAQRLMPLYLLEYSEKLFENHPDPEAPWGGGSDYTAGYGIDITNDQISIDQDIVATKNDLNEYIKNNDTNYSAIFRGQYVTVKEEGTYTTTTYGDGVIGRTLPYGVPGYTYSLPNQSGTIALTSDIPSLTNYVTTTQLEDALDDYALKTDIPENVSDLNNDAGYTTQTWVENQGYITGINSSDVIAALGYTPGTSNFSGSYNDLTDKPTIPTVNDPTITFTQGGVTKGSITLNQSSNQTIALDAGSSSVDWTDITNKPNLLPIKDASETFTFTATGDHFPPTRWDENQACTSTWICYGSVEALPIIYLQYWFFMDECYAYPQYVFSDQDGYHAVYSTEFDGNSTSAVGGRIVLNAPSLGATWTSVSTYPVYGKDPVNNATITLTQGGVTKGSFTVNQWQDQTIALDAAGSSYTAGTGIDIINNTISIDNTVALKSEIPTVTNDLISVDLGIIGTSGTLSNDLYNALTANPEKTIVYTNSYAGSNKVQLFYDHNTGNDLYYSGVCKMEAQLGQPSKWYHYVLRVGLVSSELGEKHYTLGNVDTGVALKENLSTVATSGSYNDLTNKPTIPDAVSGTNDGTNWTSLTVGNDTYAIPQGGSAPGLIGEVLFSSASGTEGDITLSKSLTNYSYIDIEYFNTENVYNTTRVYSPNGKLIGLETIFDNPSSSRHYMISIVYSLSGTSMTVQSTSLQSRLTNNAAVVVSSGAIKVTKVIGYKANSSALTTETWTFTLQDGTTITKNIVTA